MLLADLKCVNSSLEEGVIFVKGPVLLEKCIRTSDLLMKKKIKSSFCHIF
jgi:hypothetical protein